MKKTVSVLALGSLLIGLTESLGATEAIPPLSLDELSLEGWTPEGPAETFRGEKLYEAIDGFADFHFGFDFREAQRRFFTQGDKKMEVFVYRFGSPAESFGLYTVMRPRWGEPVAVGDDAVCEEANLCAVWRGEYYLAVTTLGTEVAPKEDLLNAARSVAQEIDGEYHPPKLVKMLPREHLQPLSVLYFHCLQPLDRVFYLGEGNVLRLPEKPTDPHEVQAVYAEYDQKGRTAIVIGALYPTPEKARKARHRYAAQLASEAASITEEGPWRDFRAPNGLHTLLLQREKWLLTAADVVDVDALKAVLTKLDQALRKQWEEEQKKKSEKKVRP